MQEKKVWIAVSNEATCRIDPSGVNGGEGYVQAVDIEEAEVPDYRRMVLH